MPPGPRQAGGSGNGGGYGASASTSSGSSTSTNGTSTTSTTSTKTTGTSTSTAVPAPLNPHKRRRLQFTSELPVTIPRWNPDGTETQEWLRYQSNLRLKSKWDSICQKFSNAHLLPQDEIHLGDERKGEEMRVIKDRGILRQVTEPIEFGMFHIRDQDLKHVRIVGGRPKDKRSVKGTDGDSSSEDELAEWTHTVQFSRIARPPTAAPSNRNRIAVTANGHDDAGSQDAQLAEFLEAEARRRALVDQHSLDSGEDERDEEDEDDDEDEVYDFADPNWDKGLASPLDDPEPIPSSNRDPSPTSSADEFDIISAMSDPEEDAFDRWASDKRQNVEDVLTAPEPFASIPFGDMDGLAECIERHLAEQAPPDFRRPIGNGLLPSDAVIFATGAADEGDVSLVAGHADDAFFAAQKEAADATQADARATAKGSSHASGQHRRSNLAPGFSLDTDTYTNTDTNADTNADADEADAVEAEQEEDGDRSCNTIGRRLERRQRRWR
ncbi:uncharacterized protein PFL1_01439 [Pseudozyma flocculosa PF-1]|uniref:uncharacterized protein n=1 Tax=Pseudozyma flocculosa PF-1 TaxID=1277687 RepID=UPI0004560C48|nr:uncharacterized protein PFL1_01439 [Pseudozyma flocculosa PF-1]EPQ31254.1 hypothetical protein PFL1_01439 [Pseudozyma flocculosa PF-1]